MQGEERRAEWEGEKVGCVRDGTWCLRSEFCVPGKMDYIGEVCEIPSSQFWRQAHMLVTPSVNMFLGG